MSGASLEDRYRRLLRWFPSQWREYREEEVLAFLMEGASAEGRTRPTTGERWDLVTHGVAARVDALATPQARRRTATLAACSGGAMALVCLALGELAPWLGPRLLAAAGVGSAVAPTRPGYGVIPYGLWLVALVLMAAWRPRLARRLLAVVAVLALAGPWLSGALGLRVPPLYLCLVFGLLAALAATAEVTPRFGRTSVDSLIFGAVLVVGAGLMGIAARPLQLWQIGEPSYGFYRLDFFGLSAIGSSFLVAIAPAIGLVVVLAVAKPRLRPWVGPALVVAVPWTEWALLAGSGSTARAGLPAAVILAAAVSLVLVGLLAGLRVTGPPRQVDTGSATT